MRNRTYYKGLGIGWEWAGTYFTGSREVRHEIRRKLHRMQRSFNPLVCGIWESFADRCEQRASAIDAGLAPKTINPRALRLVLDRV